MPIDKNRYPPDWEERSQRIKDRDNWTCRHCGARHLEIGQHTDSGVWLREEQIHELLGEGLIGQYMLNMKTAVVTVAHLDHDETNWIVTDDRLATLCATCHLIYDAQDNAQRRAYGKHYRDNQLEFEFDF